MVVEPGIGWMELNEYLEPHGLFFPLDPGKFVTSSPSDETCSWDVLYFGSFIHEL